MVKLFQRGEASATVGVSEYLSWGLAGRVFLTPEGLTLSWSPSLFTARAFPVMTGNVILILYWTKQPLTSVNVWLLPVIWSVLSAFTHASVDSAIVKNWDSRNLLSITVTEIKRVMSILPCLKCILQWEPKISCAVSSLFHQRNSEKAAWREKLKQVMKRVWRVLSDANFFSLYWTKVVPGHNVKCEDCCYNVLSDVKTFQPPQENQALLDLFGDAIRGCYLLRQQSAVIKKCPFPALSLMWEKQASKLYVILYNAGRSEITESTE